MQKIIHIDMDCFFAAVEMRDYPQYRDIPFAIGGKPNERGVISTCNYPARKYGVRSAMPSHQAMKLCPDLTLIPGRMWLYKEVSEQISEIFLRYTDKIEPLSLDEAYLDVTGSSLHHGSATLIAQAIRHDIFTELNLTASAGVAPVKFIAKIASDLNKPDGLSVITPEDVPSFVKTLELSKIPGVGKVTLDKLQKAGFYTCDDIQKADRHQLIVDYGRLGVSLWQRSHGIDERKVESSRERKSIGVEHTFLENISSYESCWEYIESDLYPKLKQRLQKADPDMEITKQGIKIKFADFKQTTIEHQFNELNLDGFKSLLKEVLVRQQGREIRLLGVNVTLKPKYLKQQLSLI